MLSPQTHLDIPAASGKISLADFTAVKFKKTTTLKIKNIVLKV